VDLSDAAAHWVEHGYVMLPGFLPAGDVAAAREDVRALFPTREEFHDDADPSRNAAFRDGQFAGIVPFPFPGTDLALLGVHPRLVALAEAILETGDVRVYGFEVWAKYAGAADYEQEHHRDVVGHTTLVPSDARAYRGVETFVYLEDVGEGDAPTRHVSRTLTGHLPVVPRSRSREEEPSLYDAETWCAGPAGTVVAWSVDTFHRAVRFADPRGARFTLQVNFRAAVNESMQRYGWGYPSISEEWHRFVERAPERALRLFGFPPPGDAFWTPSTLAAMALRYPGLDLGPWRADTQ